jgi:biotin carboxyl carrier protein
MSGQPYSYVVKVGDREYPVQVIPLDATRFKVIVEGSEIEVVVGSRQGQVGATTPAPAATTSTPAAVPKASTAAPAEVGRPSGSPAAPAAPTPAPQPQAPQQPTQPAAAPVAPAGAVEAPIPGKVLKVLVNVGDTVSPGQLVATLESMKMEVQVLSSRGGRVREVRVRPGDFVNVGDPIILLE